MIQQSAFDIYCEQLNSIYRSIETDLIVNIAKKLNKYNGIKGSLQWQMDKLRELSDLRAENTAIFDGYNTYGTMYDVFSGVMFGNLDFSEINRAYNAGLSKLTAEQLKASPLFRNAVEMARSEFNANNIKLIRNNSLTSANQEFMNILNQVYIETTEQIYDYNTCIARACGKLADKGITAAQYQRKDGAIVNYSIEGVVRRDVMTALNQFANDSAFNSAKEIGAEYVEVSQHFGARVNLLDPIANHAGWQGFVYKIEGHDSKYRNLEESTGYPTDYLGLGGINCRHRMFPFFPGISVKKPIMYTLADNEEQQKLVTKQRRYERAIRETKREIEVYKELENKEFLKSAKEKLNRQVKKLDRYCQENDLKRDFSRERIYLQGGKKR